MAAEGAPLDAKGAPDAEGAPMDGAGPPFEVAAPVLAVLETLWRNEHAAYLVGGGVRDALLGLPVIDWDVATDARPGRILELFPGATYENRFGTVQAGGLEVTTFRREHRYADHRRPDSVTFSDDIFEDLARRDLTINAIAWGRRGPGSAWRVVDPADGRADLAARLVRAVGDPGARFDEDALRLLRAVRIAARLGFTIEPVTRAAIVAHARDVALISEERVGGEVRAMLDMAMPSRAFELLRETGLLVTTLPELDVPEADRPGAESAAEGVSSDAFGRSLVALDAAVAMAPGNERVALAALLGTTGASAARRLLQRLCIASRDGEAIAKLIELAATDVTTEWSDADVRRYMSRVPAEMLDDLLTLRRARATVTGSPTAITEDELLERVHAERIAGHALRLADLAIDGRDLRDTLGIPEGPAIGRILDSLLVDVLEEPSLNRRLTLITRASLMLDGPSDVSPDD